MIYSRNFQVDVVQVDYASLETFSFVLSADDCHDAGRVDKKYLSNILRRFSAAKVFEFSVESLISRFIKRWTVYKIGRGK